MPTIFPDGIFDWTQQQSIPVVVFQLLKDDVVGTVEEEAMFHLFSDVSFDRTVEMAIDTTVARKPIAKLISKRPKVARVTVRTASTINISVDDKPDAAIQVYHDYKTQLSFMERMYGRMVRMVHRSGVVTGICSNLGVADDGAVHGKLYENSVDDARLNISVEIIEVQRTEEGGGIRLGKIRYPVPVQSVKPDGTGLDGALGGVGEHSCTKEKVVVLGAEVLTVTAAVEAVGAKQQNDIDVTVKAVSNWWAKMNREWKVSPQRQTLGAIASVTGVDKVAEKAANIYGKC